MARKDTVVTLPVRYLDPSAYVPGVPQCDLTAEQWTALPAQVRAWALASGLYAVDADLPADAAATVQAAPATGECEPCQQ